MRDLWRYIVVGMAAALLMAAFVGAAQAQTREVNIPVYCAPRDVMAENLRAKHGETPINWGMINNRAIAELWASPSGSWTLTVTQPDGDMCAVASGQGWEVLALGPRGDPA